MAIGKTVSMNHVSDLMSYGTLSPIENTHDETTRRH